MKHTITFIILLSLLLVSGCAQKQNKKKALSYACSYMEQMVAGVNAMSDLKQTCTGHILKIRDGADTISVESRKLQLDSITNEIDVYLKRLDSNIIAMQNIQAINDKSQMREKTLSVFKEVQKYLSTDLKAFLLLERDSREKVTEEMLENERAKVTRLSALNESVGNFQEDFYAEFDFTDRDFTELSKICSAYKK